MERLKITVLRRAVYEDLAAEHAVNPARKCELFSDGQSFVANPWDSGAFPCGWAWNDMQKQIQTVANGGSFEGWMKRPRSVVACCTDGFRPVTFLVEMVDGASLLDLSAASDSAPSGIYGSERWGEFRYVLDGLAPGSSYRLRLHFAEVYHGQEGKRVFDVRAEGRTLLKDFDIVEEAGGAYKALVREFTVAADAKGRIAVEFAKGKADNPKLSGLELRSADGAELIIAIDAGGKGSGAFKADERFEGGVAAD
jgi:uncharacterized repeat protein (TIGR04076 family)